MKYINAKDILPNALVKELQNYIQGGYIYVPIKHIKLQAYPLMSIWKMLPHLVPLF